MASTPPTTRKPNIVVIMSDDVGTWNIGAYHRGMMAGRTPHLDKLAAEGMLFTHYYGEASCTAGRSAFITGQLPIRTGLTTVGQAGADVGMPDSAPTIATALKDQGYATGQFGKNHLGDLNKYLPTVHGFDEYLAGSTTSMPRRTRRTPASRRSCWTRSARATWSILGHRIRMTGQRCRAGARSASKG